MKLLRLAQLRIIVVMGQGLNCTAHLIRHDRFKADIAEKAILREDKPGSVGVSTLRHFPSSPRSTIIVNTS